VNPAIKIIVFMLAVSFSTMSQAATDEDVVVVKRSVKEIYEDSSEANRIGKKFDIHYTLLGISANNAPAQGIGVGYFLDRNKQVLVEVRKGRGAYMRYRYESYNGVSKEWSTDAQITQVGAHFKHYVGNSFYYRVGADYSSVDYKYDLSGSYYGDTSSSYFKGTAIIGSFVIGNQWQWENFTLGCDWIGLASPLTYTISGVTTPTTASEKSDMENDQRMYVSDSSGILLRLYLGASF
tara:strand:- start:26098 stop:26808 length:711 start_codon:yes stop_codon:yes gene_type:complete